MKNILYTIILSYLFSFSVNSEIYKTIDEDGNIIFTDKKPLINSEHYTSEELLKLKEKAFKEYYMRWKWIFKRGLKTIN